MIISSSRRTDIPSYYSDWFFNRIKAGFVMVRNPRNFNQVKNMSLASEDVDCIVFWTKNPAPMVDKLDILKEYMYYFQFSITPYGRDVEANLPSKTDAIIPTFKNISSLIGADRLIWRYDPILINAKYTTEYHLQSFEKIAKELQNHTKQVIISFVDIKYQGLKRNTKELALSDFPRQAQLKLAEQLANTAQAYGLKINACAEEADLRQFGIGQAKCIDGELIENLLDRSLSLKKDNNQRANCGCASSVDIGMYNTCKNGCKYCYANYNPGLIDRNYNVHNITSPFLISE